MRFQLEISDENAEKLHVKSVKEVRKIYTLDEAREEFYKHPTWYKARFGINNYDEVFELWRNNLLRDSNADKLYTVNPDGSITAWEYNYYTSIFTLEELMEIINILGSAVIGNGIISTEME